jgi:hypothetical protein
VAGYTWADVGRRLPYDQFVQFVLHAPPGTALFHEYHNGWTVTDYLLTDLLEVQDVALCTKTKDPQKAIRRLKPRPRPGQQAKQQKADAKQVMTVEDYVKRTGIRVNIGE